MCGIAGILSFDPLNLTRHRLQLMTDSIMHRGPDGEGFWINERQTVGLGHRRLAIIDLSAAAAQPMHFAGRYAITYNGEIYNYIEIRDALQKKGYAFTTQSDTEVILAAYDCFGIECLQYFDGMFAFAIWDEKEGQLLCARDRFGEKPFYYCQQKDSFLFASEMKALWAAGFEKKTVPAMLLNYLSLGLTIDPFDNSQTFFENIFTLPPGNFMVLSSADQVDAKTYSFKIQSYWDLDKETMVSIDESKAIETFTQLFQTSVNRRLRSDVTIGTSLSGGLDSSAIVAFIHQNLQQKDHYGQAGFSAVFPGFAGDETSYIKQVSEKFQLNNYQVSPTALELIGDFQRLTDHQEEPFQSLSIYAQYKVYELAKQNNVTVLLDGQGADETMAGYHKYYHWYWQELLAAGEFKKCRLEMKLSRQNGVVDHWDWKNYLAAFLPTLAARQLEKKAISEVKEHPYLNHDFFGTDKGMLVDKPVVRHLNEILYYNTRQLGLVELLRYADRNSMAHSREVRLPFLNHQLVEFVFSLPSSYKIRNGFTKWILRQSVDKLLPPSIVWRKDKIGFEPPQQQWMQDKTMQEFQHESRRNLVSQGVLKSAVLKTPLQPLAAHDAGNFDWRYLCAEMCMR